MEDFKYTVDEIVDIACTSEADLDKLICRLIDMAGQNLQHSNLISKLSDASEEWSAILWSVGDIEERARHLEDWDEKGYSHDNPMPEEERTYDRSKFPETLDLICGRKHDATIGVSWDVIDVWLDMNCMKE